MTALVGSKQEQCVAETSRIQPAADWVPKISLMFTLSGKQRLETHYKWRLTAVICTFFVDCYTTHEWFYDLKWINQSHSSVQQVLSSQWLADSKKREKNPMGLLGKLKELLGIQSFIRVWGWAYWKCTGKRSEWETVGWLGRKARQRRIVKTRRVDWKKKKHCWEK